MLRPLRGTCIIDPPIYGHLIGLKFGSRHHSLLVLFQNRLCHVFDFLFRVYFHSNHRLLPGHKESAVFIGHLPPLRGFLGTRNCDWCACVGDHRLAAFEKNSSIYRRGRHHYRIATLIRTRQCRGRKLTRARTELPRAAAPSHQASRFTEFAKQGRGAPGKDSRG